MEHLYSLTLFLHVQPQRQNDTYILLKINCIKILEYLVMCLLGTNDLDTESFANSDHLQDQIRKKRGRSTINHAGLYSKDPDFYKFSLA